MKPDTLKLGVLISGSGTNLQAILDAIAGGTLDAKVTLVLSNIAAAQGLERARTAGVPTKVIDHRGFLARTEFDAAVVQALREHGAEWVVLAGFMRVVTPVLLDAFPMRVINVHPALLPAFPGTHGVRQALEYGVRVAGCTVHLVDQGTDTGPIVAQAAVPVFSTDDEATLAARILVEEHALLPKVLQWIADGRMKVQTNAGAEGRVRVDIVDSEKESNRGR